VLGCFGSDRSYTVFPRNLQLNLLRRGPNFQDEQRRGRWDFVDAHQQEDDEDDEDEEEDEKDDEEEDEENDQPAPEQKLSKKSSSNSSLTSNKRKKPTETVLPTRTLCPRINK
jgi:TATA-binding protein-associated factor Taf7